MTKKEDSAVLDSKMTHNERITQELLDKLAELGGGLVTEESIDRSGARLNVPETMTLTEAQEYLAALAEAEERGTNFTRKYKYRPLDGAWALQHTLMTLFGSRGVNIGTPGFFGNIPPEMKTINVDVDETIEVPWGQIELQQLEATIKPSYYIDPELGMLFHLAVHAPRKHRNRIKGLFEAVQHTLDTLSIYRGKAFDGQGEPDFLDLTAIDVEQAIYADAVTDQLEANVWSLLSHTELMRELRVPLKRAVLLEGPFGSGKTLAAFVTAVKAVNAEVPWTFIYCRPGKDNLEHVMQTARLYQPAVVFYEDVDTIAATGDADPLSRLLDLFDGIRSKGTEIMVVMTTNYKDKLHKGMLRPGRLDSIIHVGAQDAHSIERMITKTVAPELIKDSSLEFEAIGVAMEGFLPAFVREAIDRATRYAIARTGGKPDRLTTHDFVRAAEGLRPQLDLMNGAGEGEKTDKLSTLLRNAIVGDVSVLDEDGEKIYSLDGNHR